MDLPVIINYHLVKNNTYFFKWIPKSYKWSPKSITHHLNMSVIFRCSYILFRLSLFAKTLLYFAICVYHLQYLVSICNISYMLYPTDVSFNPFSILCSSRYLFYSSSMFIVMCYVGFTSADNHVSHIRRRLCFTHKFASA